MTVKKVYKLSQAACQGNWRMFGVEGEGAFLELDGGEIVIQVLKADFPKLFEEREMEISMTEEELMVERDLHRGRRKNTEKTELKNGEYL